MFRSGQRPRSPIAIESCIPSMRRGAAILVAAVLIAGLPGCAGNGGSDDDPGGTGGFGDGNGGFGAGKTGQPGFPGKTGQPGGGGPDGFHGLYTGYKKGYVYLWPNGKFTEKLPSYGTDAIFNFDATVATLTPRQWGSYRTTPAAGSPGALDLSFSFEDGTSREDVLAPQDDGSWWMKSLGIVQVIPPKFTELDGTFTREWSVSVDGGDLTVGKYAYLQFKPGRLFHYLNSTQVTVETAVGNSVGSVAYTDIDFLNSIDTNEGGRYSIEGLFMRLKFDSGPEVVSYFEYLAPTMYGDNYWTHAFLTWGGHQYSCEGCTTR